MASTLRIPPRFIAGLQVLTDLTEEDFDGLMESLSEPTDRLATERLAARVEDSVAALADGSAVEVLESVLSVVSLLPEGSAGADDLAREVGQSQDLDGEENQRERVTSRLHALMKVDIVHLAARARDVVSEYGRVFHDARVLTDIRPVFGNDAKAGPKAAMVMSELKVEFHDVDHSIEAHFYAMDRDDLERLRDVVDRALDKTDALKAMIMKSDTPFWEYRESDAAAE